MSNLNLFSTLIGQFTNVGGLSGPDSGSQNTSPRKRSTDASINVSDERAMQLSAVWACTQLIVNSVCSLPLKFYRSGDDGSTEVSRNHPLRMLFDGRPNRIMKPRDFRKAITTQQCLWANAYAEITFRDNGEPISIYPLRPGRMTPVLLNGELTYHYQTPSGLVVYAAKSIMHLKGLGSDGVVGFERNNYAREAYGLAVSADVYAAKQFAHSGRSGGGYLMFDTFLNRVQREQATELYGNISSTAYEKGKPWLLEGGVKYMPDDVEPDKMQMIETRKMQVSEISRFFGVPEVLIGGGSAVSAWPASFEQQLLSFMTFTLQDYIDEWEHAVKYSLIRERGIYADHDVTGFIKMDSAAKVALHSSWVQNGIKTRNEIRKINGDLAIDGADDLTAQSNLTPLDKLGTIPLQSNSSQTDSTQPVKQ